MCAVLFRGGRPPRVGWVGRPPHAVRPWGCVVERGALPPPTMTVRFSFPVDVFS